MKPENTGKQNCNFIAPPTDKFYQRYPDGVLQSAEDVVLQELNNASFRWYPKNKGSKAFISINKLAFQTLYGTDGNGQPVQFALRDLVYNLKITGADGFVHEGCTTPAFGVTNYYGIKDLPDGSYEVEFVDYHTDYGVSNGHFNVPSF